MSEGRFFLCVVLHPPKRNDPQPPPTKTHSNTFTFFHINTSIFRMIWQSSESFFFSSLFCYFMQIVCCCCKKTKKKYDEKSKLTHTHIAKREEIWSCQAKTNLQLIKCNLFRVEIIIHSVLCSWCVVLIFGSWLDCVFYLLNGGIVIILSFSLTRSAVATSICSYVHCWLCRAG